MRRSSLLIETGELPLRCRALSHSLRIVRSVSVGICDRLAVPVLIGIVRPLILLPPAALCGWSVEQLEMVLLHKLSHVRRWDNLVNLIQRFVESLLFFHPVVWWLSGWVRLERELCCDRLVVERLGQNFEYVELLVSFAVVRHWQHSGAMAMADRHVLTRIGRLLNQEERSMNLTMPEGPGLPGAIVFGMSLTLGLPAAQVPPASDSNEKSQQFPGTADDDVKDIPVLEARPLSEPLSLKNTNATTRRLKPVEPKNPRSIKLLRRNQRRLEIVQLPVTSDGVMTYRCRGGIKIVCDAPKFGKIQLEADEAVIKRVNPEEPVNASRGETWHEEANLPIEVHLKGNVIFLFDHGKIAGAGDEQTIRASQLDFDFVTGRLVAIDAEIVTRSASGQEKSWISTSRLQLISVRPLNRSLTPSGRPTTRAEHVRPSEPTASPNPSAKNNDSKTSKPF